MSSENNFIFILAGLGAQYVDRFTFAQNCFNCLCGFAWHPAVKRPKTGGTADFPLRIV
jgi:hypothetical protein